MISLDPAVYWPALLEKESTKGSPFFLTRKLSQTERHDLGALSKAEVAQLADPEARAIPRLKVGIAREIEPAVRLTGLPTSSGAEHAYGGGRVTRLASGRLAWTTSFSSPGAVALRIFIEEAHLPVGAEVFVFSDSGEAHGPYLLDAVSSSGGFWTNSVFASEVFLQVQFPLPTPSESVSGHLLTVSRVAHMNERLQPSTGSPRTSPESIQSLSCLVDESCISSSSFANIDAVSRSAARLNFPVGSSFFLCSGGLMNSTDGLFIPYLLTANHCFSTQASASALEATWNFKTPFCNSFPFPDPSTFPRTLGATLLATDASSDFTFVRLAQPPPAGSILLGWQTADHSLDNGALLYRVSYPLNAPQFFSQHTITAVPSPFVCSGRPQGHYIYSKNSLGGTDGGSSGSPAFTANGQVFGQLYGICGTNQSDNCDTSNNSTVDGAFFNTFPFVAQWLSPSGHPACVANATTLCLSGGRFKVTTTFLSSTSSGNGTAVSLSGDTGYFWFFSSSNLELVVKVLDACFLNSRKWVFGGGLTDVNVILTVTDTQTGAVRSYFNPQSTPYQPIQDTSAFSTCP